MNSANRAICTDRSAQPEILTVIEAPRKEEAPRKLPAIQILRGLAAVLVVFHHSSVLVATHNVHPSWVVDSRLNIIGAAGVDIFFVISGFIMYYTTIQKKGIRNAAGFLRKRTLRIYPLYWFWTSMLLLVALSKLAQPAHTHDARFVLSSYLLIPVFNGKNFDPFLYQGWTLSFEMLFYCVFALGIWINCRKSILVFLSASFTGMFVVSLFLPPGGGAKYLFSNTVIIEFLFGVALAQLFLRTGKKTPPKLLRKGGPVVLMALGSGLLLSTVLIPTAQMGLFIWGPWRFVVWGIPSALIVLGFVTWKRSFTHPALVYLGDASYSTYLAHIFVLSAFRLALEHASILRRVAVDPEIVVVMVVTILLTLPTYQWIERPLTSLARSTSARERLLITWKSLKQSA